MPLPWGKQIGVSSLDKNVIQLSERELRIQEIPGSFLEREAD
jgi:hypothetical protein